MLEGTKVNLATVKAAFSVKHNDDDFRETLQDVLDNMD
jgi:hypothetical protein